MKKALSISCLFLIFNIQYSIFNCNAQVDTAAISIEQVFIEADTIIVVNEPNIINEEPNIINETEIITKTKKSTPADSVQVKRHNPKKASLLALIPGAGQIYNKKYWKLPIVYGGLGSTGFLIYYYGRLTTTYRKEYVARLNNDTGNLNPDLEHLVTESVERLRNDYRRNMEICVAACAIIYMLSILDASVDAHLFYYDISENLSLGIKPKIDYNPINGIATPSVGLVLKF